MTEVILKSIMLITILLLSLSITTSFRSIRTKPNAILLHPFYRIESKSKSSTSTSLSSSSSSSSSLSSSSSSVPSEPSMPSTIELLGFGIPTLGIWLLQPILSLIDTAVVGMVASPTVVTQLAAIGPGIAWIDGTSYLCQFVGIATTNLYAVALSESGDNEKSRKILSHAFFISLLFGVVLNIVQYMFAPSMVKILSGPNAKECINFALSYARIRSFAAIFAVPSIVAQSAFLASKDAVTPLKAVLVGALANIIGDLYFVRVLKLGLRGAAIATTLAQVFGAFYLIKEFVIRISKDKVIQGESILKKLKKCIFIPSLNDTARFLKFCGPLSFILFAKSFLWSYTTYAISTAGTASLAAHQITINIFLFFVIFGDVTSQMSQTYLPAYFMIENSTLSRAQAGSEAVFKIARLGIVLGIINSIIGLLLQYYGNFIFTSEQPIVTEMLKVPFLLSAAIFPHAFMTSFEGVLLALRDTKFHVLVYFATGLAFVMYQTIVRMKAGGIFAVWSGFCMFQYVRLLIFTLRSQIIIKKVIKKVKSSVA